MKIKLSVVCLLLFVFAWCAAAQESEITAADSTATQTDSVVVISKSPKGAMLRSLVAPGWGQFYNGKWFKGIVIGGTEVGLIVNAVVQNQLAEQSTNYYDKEFYRENRSLSIWWFAGVVLFSITDAFVDAHLYDFDDSPEVSMNINRHTDIYALQSYPEYRLTLKLSL